MEGDGGFAARSYAGIGEAEDLIWCSFTEMRGFTFSQVNRKATKLRPAASFLPFFARSLLQQEQRKKKARSSVYRVWLKKVEPA